MLDETIQSRTPFKIEMNASGFCIDNDLSDLVNLDLAPAFK